ncbi:MAG: ATP-binding protein, partial [Flavobacteriaceae bacterium]|nr:ATP-binding protein [Flavobacteriaceae bacterium]
MSYDLRFKAPFSLILSGVSGSGKTTWVENLLRNYKNLIE